MTLSNLCSFSTLFTLICTILTLLLIFQELFTFAVVKPTTSSREEKERETSDLPDVVFCLDPAFDSANLTRFGYQRDSYFRGSRSMDDYNVVGWNEQGGENVTNRKGQTEKSSLDILNEVLVFDDLLLEKLVLNASYVEHKDGVAYVKPEKRFRTLAYPYGRCLVLSPPTESISSVKLDVLYLKLQTDIGLRERKTKLKIFFMEKSSSLLLYPHEVEMSGENPYLKLWGNDHDPVVKTYKVKIPRAHHVQGDPHYDCSVYTIDNSYNDCVQNKVLKFFDKEIRCQPPLLAKDPNLMCNTKFNVSSSKAEKINGYFWQLYIHNLKFKFRTPCSTTKFTTRLVHTQKLT